LGGFDGRAERSYQGKLSEKKLSAFSDRRPLFGTRALGGFETIRDQRSQMKRSAVWKAAATECADPKADYNQSVKYRIYIEQDEDGVFIVTCPALPGCVSQGRTRQEACDQIRDAIELYLQSLREHGEAVPSGLDEAVIEVPAA